MATNKTDRSFKTLINKRTTDENKAFYEEIGDQTLNIQNSEIWADAIADNDPATAVANGVAEFRSKLVLTEDVTVASQQAWFADDSGRLKDWISDKNGSLYTAKLFDNNDSEIFPTDALDWFFDYQTGILTISGNAGAFTQPFKIDGYRYIGQKGIVSADSEFLTTNFDVTFQPDVDLYVETTGSDNNDGRSSSTAFATLQRAFDELPPAFIATVRVNIGPGSFAGALLRSSGPLYVDGYVQQVGVASSLTDNGFLSGKAIQRSVTSTGFDGYASEGTNFWFVDEFAGAFPLFTSGAIVRDSPAPNSFVLVNEFAPTYSSAVVAEWGTTLTSRIGVATDIAQEIINTRYLHFDTTSGTHFASGLSMTACKVTGANGFVVSKIFAVSASYFESELFLRKDGGDAVNWQDNVYKNRFNFESTTLSISKFKAVSDTTATPKMAFGNLAPVGVTEFGPCDFEGAGECIRVYPNCDIDQDGETLTCEGTGRLLDLQDNSTWIGSGPATGTVTAPILIRNGAKATRLASYALSNTSTAGDDITIGTTATASSFGDLPVVDLGTLTMALDT